MAQNIKTNYKPTSSIYSKSEDEILDRHMDRRGLNRIAREEQRTPVGRIRGFFENVAYNIKNPSQPKRHEHHEKRERNTRHERSESVEWEREEHRPTRTVVHHYYDGRPAPKKKKHHQARRSSGGGGMGAGLGMQDFIPSNMGLGDAMGYPMQGLTPRAPSKKKRGSSAGSWADPGYIPPSLRHMF